MGRLYTSLADASKIFDAMANSQKAALWLRKDREELLAFYDFPALHGMTQNSAV